MKKIGVLGLIKPQGVTSFDVVRTVKRVTGIKKIGHGGTLDPMAYGTLPILLNEATAFFDVLLQSSKVYRTEIQLGVETDTDDKEGQVTKTMTVPDFEEGLIEQIIRDRLTGDIMQEPPIYSALKVNGKRAYDLARSGEEVQLPPRLVTIYGWSDIEYDRARQVITATIRCGSGTYIRSLGRDLAKYLGTVGHLISLCRLSSGGIEIEDGVNLEELADTWESRLISPEKALSFLPSLEWEGDFAHLIHGKPVHLFTRIPNDDGIYRLMYRDKIVSLVEKKESRLSYKKNLANIYAQEF